MTYSLTFTEPLTAGDIDLMRFLSGAASAPGPLPVPAPTDFPDDPTRATTPSPDSSTVMIFNGKIVGPSYLKDSDGSVWTLELVLGIGHAKRNGNRVTPADPAWSITQLMVRGGHVWCFLNGQQQYFNNGSLYNGEMPAAASTPPAPPAIPSLPPHAAVAPGSSGFIIHCGSGYAAATLSAGIAIAHPGDTILLAPGVYNDAPPAWTIPLLIDLGGATFQGVPTDSLARGKGLFVPGADAIIQNGTILGVAADQTEGQLTCAIRPDAGCGWLTIRNITAHENQCAVGHGGFPCVIDIEASDVSHNGLMANTDAHTHNIYIGKECLRLTLTDVISHGCNDGHALKYRGPELIVTGGTYGAFNGSCIDLPNGTAKPFTVTNAALVKASDDQDHVLIRYGEEGASNGLAGGTINGGTIAADCPSPIVVGAGGTITASGVTFSGGKVTGNGVALIGF